MLKADLVIVWCITEWFCRVIMLKADLVIVWCITEWNGSVRLSC